MLRNIGVVRRQLLFSKALITSTNIGAANYSSQTGSGQHGGQQQQKSRTLILGIGNPLLDKQLRTAEISFHKKYRLETDGTYLVLPDNEQELLPLFDDLERQAHSIEHIPGGSAQNTMRVFQWMVQSMGGPRQKAAAYFGAVGDDSNAELLRQLASAAGLEVSYQNIPEAKTGLCAVLVHGTHRCLVAYLGAAKQFTATHLARPENQRLIEEAANYYVEGFFLAVCPEAILQIAEHALAKNKPFTMNLSAEYICSPSFLDRLNSILPFVDVLFCNEREARAFASTIFQQNYKDLALGEIALRMAAIPKANKERKRTVVITCGEDRVLVAHDDGRLRQFPVQHIERARIVDTNGAGDAFCGGYLAAMATGRSLEDRVKAGNFAARTIIQHSGCTFPATCQYQD